VPISDSFAQRLAKVVPSLAESYGTPFHIYDLGAIVAAHHAIVAAFDDWPFRQYFAVKALPTPAVLLALVAAGSGLDCSSPAELRLAETAGARGEAIVFTSNNTTPSELRAAMALGAQITFDDTRHLSHVAELPPVVAFRVAPRGTSTLMGTAADSKFGVPARFLAAAYAEAKRRGATRFGLHGMTCANELDASKAIQAAEELIATAHAVEREVGISFEYVNFGGGMGIPYRPGDRPFDFAYYARAIREGLARAFPGRRVAALMECGRCVSGPHGVLVTRVVNRMRKDRELVGVDASMSSLMRPAFYKTAYHHVSLPFASERPEVAVDVVGSLCENIDKFAVERLMPDPREGDLLYVHDTGAHGLAMGWSYNGRLRPAELALTEDDRVIEIRRAETFEDYVATVRWEPVEVAR